MKTGDIVKLNDGSYNMSLIEGELKHIPGVYCHHCTYRVVSTMGAYPTNESCASVNVPLNDAMLVDINDHNFVLFTRERFCSVVTPAIKEVLQEQLEIVVPRGIKEVHLVLQ